jgi:hypothetical protein
VPAATSIPLSEQVSSAQRHVLFFRFTVLPP